MSSDSPVPSPARTPSMVATLPLSPEHLRTLRDESAISEEVIRARGYRTATRKSELLALGFSARQARVPALVVPVWGVSGEIVLYQTRPAEPRIDQRKVVKYETPAGARMALDVPPGARAKIGDPSVPLLVTEGVKKADSAVSRGLCCIALLGVWNWRGTNERSGSVALPDWESIALRHRQVYVGFDSDVMVKPDVHGALVRLSEFLRSRGATVAYLYLPAGDAAKKVGLDDFFASGKGVGDLMTLVSPKLRAMPTRERPVTLGGIQTELENPMGSQSEKEVDDAETPSREHGKIFVALQHAQILGELDCQVLLFNSRRWRIAPMEDLRDLDLTRLIRVFGPRVQNLVRETKPADDDDPRVHIRDVRSKIAALAYRRQIPPQKVVGQGIWPTSDGRLLVVCGSAVKVWDGRKGEALTSPLFDGGLVWPDPALAWDDAEHLVALATSMTDVQVLHAFERFVDFLRRWTTRFPEDPEVMAGLAVATFIQSVWSWRPLVSVHGPFHSGKSALAEFLAGGAGRLAFLRDGKLTEAALRQEIRRDSRVALLDEFERNPHREAILQLLRVSGRGGEISRGTREHRPINFGLRHIVWMFSIDSGLRHGADITRAIAFELRMPARPGNPMPAKKEVEELGAALRALALRIGLPGREMADRLSSVEVPGLIRRQVENLAAPFAVFGIVRRMNEDVIRARLTEYARAYADGEREVGPEACDEERLLEAIASAKVRIPEEEVADGRTVYVHRELVVGQLLHEDGDDRLLQAQGISNNDDGVFLAADRLAPLLPQHWQGIDLRRVLLRVRGARATKRILAGRQTRGVLLPREVLYTPSRAPNVPQKVPPQHLAPQLVSCKRDARDTRDTSLWGGVRTTRMETEPCMYRGHPRWTSIYGVVMCRVCHPPAHPDLDVGSPAPIEVV